MASTPFVEVLSPEECLVLLAQGPPVGRLGISINALPVILPVHYALHGPAILLRTVPGSKLDAATAGAVVAFQTDNYEPPASLGWSVLVQGMASRITDRAELEAAQQVPIPSWGPDHTDPNLVRIDIAHIYGRRTSIADPGRTPGW